VTDLPAFGSPRELLEVRDAWRPDRMPLDRGLTEAETVRRKPPCWGLRELIFPGYEGEHLCRICPACGYGRVEACKGSGVTNPAGHGSD
jgi:hypothetical protein